MDLIIALVSIDIIASKLLESYIASKRLHEISRRRNLVIGKLLQKKGVENDIWLSFLSTVMLVALAVFLLNGFYSATSFQLLYIFTGLFTITLNLGSAHSSYFGKKNFITENLL